MNNFLYLIREERSPLDSYSRSINEGLEVILQVRAYIHTVPSFMASTSSFVDTWWWRSSSSTTSIVLLLLLLLSRDALGFSNLSNPSEQQVPPVILPSSPKELVRQASAAISAALLDDNIHRQCIRLPLSESMYSESEEGFVADRAIGWQGGPQETIRYLQPMVEEVLRSVETLPEKESSKGGLTPRIQSQILLEFDGSALITSECPAGAKGDASALLQPNTDSYYPKTIKQIEQTFSDTPGKAKRLFLLVNPAWRDAGSFGLFQSRIAQGEIIDRYVTTYAVDQFVVRGQKVSVVKAWPHDWCIFWSQLYPDDKKNTQESSKAQFLGSFRDRPEYSVIDDLLQNAISMDKQ
jgi:hypothetical protein